MAAQGAVARWQCPCGKPQGLEPITFDGVLRTLINYLSSARVPSLEKSELEEKVIMNRAFA